MRRPIEEWCIFDEFPDPKTKQLILNKENPYDRINNNNQTVVLGPNERQRIVDAIQKVADHENLAKTLLGYRSKATNRSPKAANRS